MGIKYVLIPTFTFIHKIRRHISNHTALFHYHHEDHDYQINVT